MGIVPSLSGHRLFFPRFATDFANFTGPLRHSVPGAENHSVLSLARFTLLAAALAVLLMGAPARISSSAQAAPSPPSAPRTKPALAKTKPALAPEARVDINHANLEELLKVPGMTPSWAGRIVRFRPYRTKQDLLDHGVLPSDVYDRIKDYIIAHRDPE
jgi:DNA uptake protein ComE-like DNA-binding protein